MNISQMIGNKINDLMEKENISLRKLSEVIGVTHPTLSKYVEGTQAIDSDKLMKIAIYFNKSFDYFFKDDSSEFTFLFRADKPGNDIKNVDINYLKDSLQSYHDILDDISYQYIPPKYYINDKDDKKNIFTLIEKIAYEQRRFANIENVIPDNYYEVIANLGIHVVVKDFKNDSYFGASSYSNDMGSYIMINDSKDISEERKIFSLIHEYAHLLFHSNQYSNDQRNAFYVNGKSDMNEKIANKFAGYFLMPKNLVSKYIESKKHIDLFEMKKHFKVSIQTLFVMLKEYDLISKEDSNNFWKQVNSNGHKAIEPAPLDKIDIQEKNSKLVSRIKELYYNESISSNKISEVLGIDTIETRKLLKEWRDCDDRYLSLK